MNSFLSKYGEWLFRGASLAGIVAILWLNSNYVSLDQYQADQEKLSATYRADSERTATDYRAYQNEIARRVTAVEVAMLVMVESNKVNERQEITLKEQELRLRNIESSIAKFIALFDKEHPSK